MASAFRPQFDNARLGRQVARNRWRGFTVVGFFMSLVIAIGAAVGFILQGASGGGFGAAIAIILILGAVIYALSDGERWILQSSRALPADSGRYPKLFELRDDLAVRAVLPTPNLYIVEDPSPNAFATGLRRKNASIAVTTGLLAVMSDEELCGVLAHEMSHIRNHDVGLLYVVTTVIGLAALLADWAWLAMDREDDGDDEERFRVVVALGGLALWIFAVFVGPLLQLALSRSRESLADVAGVVLAGEPTGLLSALRKLEANDGRLIASNHATASLFIDNPLQHHRHWFSGLFDTHPRIEQRIAALQEIAGVPVTAYADQRRIDAAYAGAKSEAQSQPNKGSAWDTIVWGAGLVLTAVIGVTHFVAPTISNVLLGLCLLIAVVLVLVFLVWLGVKASVRRLVRH